MAVRLIRGEVMLAACYANMYIALLKGQCVGIEAVQFSVISLPVKSSIIGVIQEFTINENGFPFRVLNRSAGPGQNNPSSSWSS